jgi:pimeloyl-ACP methyl ester carboxylesterase
MNDRPAVRGARRSGFRTAATEAWAKAWIARMAERSTPPLESTWVETSLGRTHVVRSPDPGTGRDVVCFPGFGTNSGWWCVAGNLTPLTQVARVWIVDVPGQPGLSAGWAPPFTRDGYDLWIEQLVDGLGLDSVSLMGVSLGGLLAVRGSVRLGSRAERMVLLAPGGFVRPWVGLAGMAVLLRHYLNATPQTTKQFVRECVLGPQQLEPEPLAELEDALFRFGTGFSNRSRIPPLLANGMLRASKAHAMIIVGESDPIFSARRTLERARRLMPNLEATESMAGHGHGLEVSGPVMELAATFIGAGP